MNTNEFYKELMSEYSFDYDKIRKAAEENLDEAVFMACSHTIQYLVDSKMPILGGTIEMYNDYTTKMKGMEI